MRCDVTTFLFLFFLVKELGPLLAERNTLGSTFPLQLNTSVVFVQRILGPELDVSDKSINY